MFKKLLQCVLVVCGWLAGCQTGWAQTAACTYDKLKVDIRSIESLSASGQHYSGFLIFNIGLRHVGKTDTFNCKLRITPSFILNRVNGTNNPVPTSMTLRATIHSFNVLKQSAILDAGGSQGANDNCVNTFNTVNNTQYITLKRNPNSTNAGTLSCEQFLTVPFTVTGINGESSPFEILLDNQQGTTGLVPFKTDTEPVNNGEIAPPLTNIDSDAFNRTIYPAPICTLSTGDVNITMPNILSSAFTQAGQGFGDNKFTLTWRRCPLLRGTNYLNGIYPGNQPLPHMTWTFATDASGPTRLKNLSTDASVASNVVIVVKDDTSGSLMASGVATPLTNPTSDLGDISRSFTASYVATSLPALAGKVFSTATITLDYH